MRVSVAPDGRRGAGHALIRVTGAAGAPYMLFRIARPAGWANPNLGPAGWQGAEADLQPLEATSDGADLVLAVGPAVCRWLEEGTFLFNLPAAGLSLPVAWPEIEEVHGGSGGTFDEKATSGASANPETPPQPTPPDVPASTSLAAAVRSIPTTTPPGGTVRKSTMPALAGLVVLLLAGAGLWWNFRGRLNPTAGEAPSQPPAQPVVEPPAPPEPRPEPPAGVPAPVPPPPPPALDLDSLSVADLVGRNRVPDMVAQARRRIATRPQDSLLLLEAAGEDRHDGGALTELARLYDPGKPRQGGVPADPRQAAKYYRAASRANDGSGREDREALRRSLQTRREAGDLSARLIEQDYWP